MGKASAARYTTTETANLYPGFCTIVHGHAVRLISFVSSVADRDYWWAETLFTDNHAIEMFAFNHGSSYRPLHSQAA